MKITALQMETLALIGAGKVNQQNTGYGSWRIFGASPTVVGRIVSMGLAKWGKPDDRHQSIALTEAGDQALKAKAEEGAR